MNRSTVYALVTAGIVVIAAALYFGTRKPATTTASPSPSPSATVAATNSPSTAASSSPQAAATNTTLTYSNSGFAPATISVKSGAQLTFKNTSGSTIQVDSNPHPQHTDNTELNVGSIPAGGSATVTLTKKGTWGIHNHLNPGMTGSVTVQ